MDDDLDAMDAFPLREGNEIASIASSVAMSFLENIVTDSVFFRRALALLVAKPSSLTTQ
jgi:hypothetical protein